jgi:hypothetical protein
MSIERELLEKILNTGWLNHELSCEVEAILAQPEPLTPRQGLEEYKKGYAKAELDLKREPLTDENVCEILLKKEWKGFVQLVRIIEKEHGIGGEK